MLVFPYLRYRTVPYPPGGLDRAFEEDGSGNRKGKRRSRRESLYRTACVKGDG